MKLSALDFEKNRIFLSLTRQVRQTPRQGLKLVYSCLDNTTTPLAALIEQIFTKAGFDPAELKEARADGYNAQTGARAPLGDLLRLNADKLNVSVAKSI